MGVGGEPTEHLVQTSWVGQKGREDGIKETYLADRLLVRYDIRGLCGLVARFKLVGYKCRTQGSDHKIMIVQSGDDGGLAEPGGKRCCDVGGRHFDIPYNDGK